MDHRIAAAIALLMIAGCGGSHLPDTYPVRGTVTINGQPLASGRIVFFPETGHQALGEIKDGRYELRAFGDQPGAAAGKYAVTVTAVEVLRGTPREVNAPEGTPPEVIREMMMESTQEQIRWVTPPQYSDRSTTPLTAEVKPGEENEIDFALQSK